MLTIIISLLISGCANLTPGTVLDAYLGYGALPSFHPPMSLIRPEAQPAVQQELESEQLLAEGEASLYEVELPKPKGPRKPCKKIKPLGNWRIHKVLYKPSAEHVGKPVVVTLPRGDVARVAILNLKREPVRSLPFRSRGDAGDAWQEKEFTAAQMNKKFRGGFWVRIRRADNSCQQFFVKDARNRSDTGKPER